MNTSAKSEHTGNSGFKKEVLEWVKILLAAAAIAFVLNTFVIANSYIPSGSMENTIMTGDRIIGSRLSYAFGLKSCTRSQPTACVFPPSIRSLWKSASPVGKRSNTK